MVRVMRFFLIDSGHYWTILDTELHYHHMFTYWVSRDNWLSTEQYWTVETLSRPWERENINVGHHEIVFNGSISGLIVALVIIKNVMDVIDLLPSGSKINHLRTQQCWLFVDHPWIYLSWHLPVVLLSRWETLTRRTYKEINTYILYVIWYDVSILNCKKLPHAFMWIISTVHSKTIRW